MATSSPDELRDDARNALTMAEVCAALMEGPPPRPVMSLTTGQPWPRYAEMPLPLPLVHQDFQFTARELGRGSTLNTEYAEAVGLRMAEQLERAIIGNHSGGESASYTSGGHTTTPSTTIEDIVAAQQAMLAARQKHEREMRDLNVRSKLSQIIPVNDHERFALEILKNGVLSVEFAACLDDSLEKIQRPDGFKSRAELEAEVAALQEDNKNLKGILYGDGR